MSARAEPGRVRIVWQVGGGGLEPTAYRLRAGAEWAAVAALTPDGVGRVELEDRAVTPGERYAYRLGIRDGDTESYAGETWIEVPAGSALALHGSRPNPTPRALELSFILPASGPAMLEVFDVSGKRLWARDVGGLGPGTHVMAPEMGSRLPQGVYLIRLTQADRTVFAKAGIIR